MSTFSQRIAPTLLALVAAMGLSSVPAMADNGKTPPGNPCGDGPGVGKGNPCGGNNGNSGAQGNAGNKSGPGTVDPTFEEIEVPAEEARGVFISQIGATNRADVDQGETNSYARVLQNGAENIVELAQGDTGTHYARIAQEGDRNELSARQDGEGQTVLMFAQEGDGNDADLFQRDDGERYSALAIAQTGNNNSLVMVQDGSDNQARLVQDGNSNTMTATQLDAGNRLEWTQDGSNLSSLDIRQEGNQTTYIYQTSNGGAAFAPGN
ncbi:hypothetical protein [Erythrobacter sp.]|uniref:hypothetical protein n=1 Tax=Erythrobacter sp. TaxID=1042 RepID=UPI003C70AFA4